MNRLWICASVTSLLTAVLRTFAGHTGPLLEARNSDISLTSIGFFHAAWYVISALCVLTACVYFYIGLRPTTKSSREVAILLAAIYILAAITVGVVNTFLVWNFELVVPVVLLFLIGLLGYGGVIAHGVSNDA